MGASCLVTFYLVGYTRDALLLENTLCIFFTSFHREIFDQFEYLNYNLEHHWRCSYSLSSKFCFAFLFLLKFKYCEIFSYFNSIFWRSMLSQLLLWFVLVGCLLPLHFLVSGDVKEMLATSLGWQNPEGGDEASLTTNWHDLYP